MLKINDYMTGIAFGNDSGHPLELIAKENLYTLTLKLNLRICRILD